MYPLLHVGVHELPLARLAGHGPASPFVGAVSLHGLPQQGCTSIAASTSVRTMRRGSTLGSTCGHTFVVGEGVSMGMEG